MICYFVSFNQNEHKAFYASLTDPCYSSDVWKLLCNVTIFECLL